MHIHLPWLPHTAAHLIHITSIISQSTPGPTNIVLVLNASVCDSEKSRVHCSLDYSLGPNGRGNDDRGIRWNMISMTTLLRTLWRERASHYSGYCQPSLFLGTNHPLHLHLISRVDKRALLEFPTSPLPLLSQSVRGKRTFITFLASTSLIYFNMYTYLCVCIRY